MLWLAQVVSEFAFAFALPFLPLFVLEIGVPDAAAAAVWAGLMAGAFAIAQAFMGPIWGVLADRYGRRLMIQRALFGGFLVTALVSIVQTPEQLLLLRVMQGSLTGVVAAMAVVVSLTVPRHRVATALGLMQAAMLLGASIGPIVGGAFVDSYGLRAGFALTSVVFLVTGVLVTWLVAEPSRVAPVGDGSGARGDGGALPRTELWTAIGVMVLIRVAQNAPAPVLPFYVTELAGSSTGAASMVGLVLAATGIAMAFSAMAVGRVADRFGRRGTLAVCLLAATVLSPLHALVSTVGQLVVLRTAMGLALGGMMPVVQALLTDRTPPERRGAVFGMLSSAQAVGNGGGPVGGGLIGAALGATAVFVASTPLFAVGAALVARLTNPGRSAPSRTAE